MHASFTSYYWHLTQVCIQPLRTLLHFLPHFRYSFSLPSTRDLVEPIVTEFAVFWTQFLGFRTETSVLPAYPVQANLHKRVLPALSIKSLPHRAAVTLQNILLIPLHGCVLDVL